MADPLEVAVVVQTEGVEKLRPVATGIRDIGAAAEESSTRLPSFYQGIEEGGEKAIGAERGARRLEFALTSMAASSLGAEKGLAGIASRVGEGALLFGAGSEAVLALGGGLAAFGLTLHLINAPLNEAEALNKKLAESFDKIASAARPSVKAMLELTAAAQQFADTQEKLVSDQNKADFFRLFGQFTGGLTGGIADAMDAAVIMDRTNEATERTMGLLLASNVARAQGTDISRRGVSDISVAENRDQFSRIPQVLNDRITQLRNLGLGDAVTDALTEPLAKGFEDAFVRGIQRAGERGDFAGAMRLRAQGIAALAAVGLPRGMAEEGDDRINAAALRVIELQQKIQGPRAAFVPQFRAPALGIGPAESTLSAPGFFGEQRPNLITTGDLRGAIRTDATSGLSNLNNLKALDKGAESAAKALEKVTIAGEKFEVAMTRTIGNALIMMTHGPSVSGVLAAGSSVLGDLSKMQKEDEAGKMTTPLASLALPATVMSVGAGLLTGLEGLFKSGISIRDYSPTAIEQLRALIVQGGIVSMNVTNSNGLSSSEAQNLINRNTSRDSIPRFPTQPAGAGR